MDDLSAPEIIAHKRHALGFKLRFDFSARRAISDEAFAAVERETFLKGITGTTPSAEAGGIVLVACNNLYYKRFVVTLILSIEQQGVRQAVHLHLCRPSPEVRAHVERLSAALSNVSLTWTEDACELAAILPYRTIYFAAVRFLIASEILAKGQSPILCIDADGIVRQPIWPLYGPCSADADALLCRRDMRSASRRILASAVGLNPTPQGRLFAASLSRMILNGIRMRPAYHIDQRAITLVSERLVKLGRLAVKQMPQSFLDHDFGEESAIWTAKGWGTKNSDRYLDAKMAVDRKFASLVPAETT